MKPGVNIAHMMQRPARLGAMPVTICNEAVAMTKDAFVAAGGMWSLFNRVVWENGLLPGPRAWGLTSIVEMARAAHRSWADPTERAYAAASTDPVRDARRVIDVLRSAVDDDSDRFGDPLASGWDDVVRRPSLLAPGYPSAAPVVPMNDEQSQSASSA